MQPSFTPGTSQVFGKGITVNAVIKRGRMPPSLERETFPNWGGSNAKPLKRSQTPKKNLKPRSPKGGSRWGGRMENVRGAGPGRLTLKKAEKTPGKKQAQQKKRGCRHKKFSHVFI